MSFRQRERVREKQRFSERSVANNFRRNASEFTPCSFAEAIYDIDRQWRFGAKCRTVRRQLKILICAYSGTTVALHDPPCYLVVGNCSASAATGYKNKLAGFNCTRCKSWSVFLGIMKKSVSSRDELWVVLTSGGDVFGYSVYSDRMYVLGMSLTDFLDNGGKNVTGFYEMSGVDGDDELALFGISVFGPYREMMSMIGRGADIRDAIKMGQGVVFTSLDGAFDFTVGDLDHLRLRYVLPYHVIECLTDEGYTVIGQTAQFQRVILARVSSGETFALMSGGYVYKLADSLLGFVRSRMYSLEVGEARCHLRPRFEGQMYVPPGQQLSFNCDIDYRLPGDYELLCHWIARRGGTSGWPCLE
ncbi:B28.4 [miniopterid betaherpesvirus 1]|uniref:B28.4 n=1 Tax=miniopterid betaherpesvirus 1 TaxID=3070189 RepID=I3VQ00_9BETA|nr:B28.4 [miniopterid betaherpesvirus 1]AFK83844.1 B28.4 [miniopterid betaherpesvirus 1]